MSFPLGRDAGPGQPGAELDQPGVAVGGQLDLDVGGPLRVAGARMCPGEAGIELDFDTAWSEPGRARDRVVNAVRERTSMDARFARWVIQATVVPAVAGRSKGH
ncbi:hypothetical protein [Pseudonocardia oroxyli]|uniref:hypothetical protein n=1 Tax=Pseudonocardia oroxyli TaxID=366584 RepID=UPI000B805F33|nr:hypothetical protein [Pseudonocardia oroxyli]